MQVFTSAKRINGTHFFRRDRPIVTRICYNVPRHGLQLKIGLISQSPDLLQCQEHKHKNSWQCNEIERNYDQCFIEPLDPNRIERCVTLQFFCNSTCRSLNGRNVLKFSIVGDSSVNCENDLKICITDNPSKYEKNVPEEEIA